MKPTSMDTTAAAHAVHIQVYKAMGPARRAAVGLGMSDDARELARAGIRRRHPDYGDSEVEHALRLLYLGPALFRAAWPDTPLVNP